jgi:hypothetical protein
MKILLAGIFAVFALPAATVAEQSKPNIAVIISDNRDGRLGLLQAQPFVTIALATQGIRLENQFATVAQYCLSRTLFLRGQASHQYRPCWAASVYSHFVQEIFSNTVVYKKLVHSK